MISSDTPINIDTMQVDDVLPYVTHLANEYVPSPKVRMNYTKMLYDVLGYHLSADVALASVDEPQAELVLSTAGGGKTTWSQVKAIEQKLVRKTKRGTGKKISGDRILCLVYNRHNVEDMKTKHANMVGKLMALKIEGIEIDNRINASTLHSFCDYIRKLFVAKLGLVGSTTLEETDAIVLMTRAIKVECKVDKKIAPEQVNVNRMLALYTLTKETLKDVSQLTYTDPFIDLGLPIPFITQVFTRYESIKRRSNKYDFVDMLYMVYNLLKTDDKALKQVQEYFDYVIADEVQDFTPLMWEILRLFVSDGTPLTCIGDEDQNIYNFRGANIDYILQFKQNFQDSKIYLLTENRRCREVILTEAINVVNENKLRFDKKIIGNKTGGMIKTYPYTSKTGQVVNLVRELKKLSPDDLNHTVVCYRNQESSRLISEMLAEEGISINCLRAYTPFSHELYNHVLSILTALELPCDRKAYKHLWKVLPCKKSEFFEAIGFSPERNTFTTSDDKIHFAKFNYGKLMGYKGFGDAIALLHQLSEALETTNLDKIFPIVYKQLCQYFWNYKRSVNENEELDNIFEQRVIAKFNVPAKYSKVFREIQQVKSICASDTRVGNGVTLATFHSLKGLEFSKVYVVDMDNDIFPNYPLIEYRNYGAKVEQQLKEAETRLWYVTVTRAIDELHIFYYESNPSKYVVDYLNRINTPLKDTSKHYSVELLGGSSDDTDDFTGDDFIEDFVEESTDDFVEDFGDFDDEDFLNDEETVAEMPNTVEEHETVNAVEVAVDTNIEEVSGVEAISSVDDTNSPLSNLDMFDVEANNQTYLSNLLEQL